MPVLGLIPIIGQGKLDPKGKEQGEDEKRADDQQVRDRDLGIFREPRSMAAECCRSIRTNILFMSPDHPMRTMVITSPSPQEGKTTTAINLAIAMAEAGGRVLLIDTDMRRPRLHRSFAVPNQVGVSTLILGNTKLEDAIKHTDIPNLDVLPCGPIPPNPSELLHTKRFAQILEDCKTRYERIILDSPPTSAVTDPAVLGNLVDGVILIVKGASTTREAAAHARRQLVSAKCRLLGVIVNEIDFSNPGYGYHYYYYRKYSRYGYTYGNRPNDRRTDRRRLSGAIRATTRTDRGNEDEFSTAPLFSSEGGEPGSAWASRDRRSLACGRRAGSNSLVRVDDVVAEELDGDLDVAIELGASIAPAELDVPLLASDADEAKASAEAGCGHWRGRRVVSSDDRSPAPGSPVEKTIARSAGQADSPQVAPDAPRWPRRPRRPRARPPRLPRAPAARRRRSAKGRTATRRARFRRRWSDRK